MTPESENLMTTLNTQDQSSLVTKESYEYYFRRIMTRPHQIKILKDSADQLQSQLYDVEQRMNEHDQGLQTLSDMPDATPRDSQRMIMRNRYNALMAKQRNLVDQLRKIYLHLTTLEAV
jgi:hypothetical protein